MRVAFLVTICVSIATFFAVNVPPLSQVRVPLDGGNAFVPSSFGSGVAVTLAAFAIGVAVSTLPTLVRRDRVASRLGSGGVVFMVQRTPELAALLPGIPLLTPVVASPEHLTFWASSAQPRHISAREIRDWRLSPRGYRGRIPTLDFRFSAMGKDQWVPIVVARQGWEIAAERREDTLEELRDRLSTVLPASTGN